MLHKTASSCELINCFPVLPPHLGAQISIYTGPCNQSSWAWHLALSLTCLVPETSCLATVPQFPHLSNMIIILMALWELREIECWNPLGVLQVVLEKNGLSAPSCLLIQILVPSFGAAQNRLNYLFKSQIHVIPSGHPLCPASPQPPADLFPIRPSSL